jgi:hypothetical protein
MASALSLLTGPTGGGDFGAVWRRPARGLRVWNPENLRGCGSGAPPPLPVFQNFRFSVTPQPSTEGGCHRCCNGSNTDSLDCTQALKNRVWSWRVAQRERGELSRFVAMLGRLAWLIANPEAKIRRRKHTVATHRFAVVTETTVGMLTQT